MVGRDTEIRARDPGNQLFHVCFIVVANKKRASLELIVRII